MTEAAPPILQRDQLRPFSSALVLECTVSDVASCIARLMEFLLERVKRRLNGEIVARGVVPLESEPLSQDDALLDVFSYRVEHPPSWLSPGAHEEWVDVHHGLVAVVGIGSLLAVHAEESLRSGVRRWIHGREMPPLRLVERQVMKRALIQGEVRNLSMKGVHQRTTLKADSKSLGGQRLQDALNPTDDGTYTAQSARSKLPNELGLRGLKHAVGTTPRTSLFWSHQHSDFGEFLQATREALELIQQAQACQVAGPELLSALADEAVPLNRASGAYEVVAPAIEELAELGLTETQDAAAAQLLERAWLEISDAADEASFDLRVGEDGVEAGVLRVRMQEQSPGEVDVGVFFKRNPTDDVVARPIHHALDHLHEHLAIYFASGHVLQGGTLYSSDLELPAFEPTACSFASYRVDLEKPAPDIHAGIGTAADRSLFSWAARRWSTGHLTCDDGAGEVADFVHLDDDGTLSLIHIKAAPSASAQRMVSAACFEVLVSQAEKNLIFLQPGILARELSADGQFASWHDGSGVANRVEMLAALEARSRRAKSRVVIVQPHLRQTHLSVVRAADRSGRLSPDVWRLRRLDALLHGARSKVASWGAEFEVLVSDE